MNAHKQNKKRTKKQNTALTTTVLDGDAMVDVMVFVGFCSAISMMNNGALYFLCVTTSNK